MISFIVAMDKNHVIGNNNQLPWHLPADLAYFKKITTGHTIVMGRKTFQSIGRALPNRENIVVTRDLHFTHEDCVILHSIEELKQLASKREDELFIIGGAEIFKETWEIADRLYVTKINHSFEGDTYFPSIDQNQWTLISEQLGERNEKNPYDFSFLIYERNEKI